MPVSLLVAYASRSGSTQEVAETIAGAHHRDALLRRPVAVFALGPFHADDKEFQAARGQLDKELLQFPWFAPVAIEILGGKFDPQTLRFPMNLIPALRKMPPSNVRDWTAIRAWASGLVGQLQPVR